MAADLLSGDQERLKNYVNVACTIQKTHDTSVKLWTRHDGIPIMDSMPLASSNKTGSKKSKFERPKTLNFITRL